MSNVFTSLKDYVDKPKRNTFDLSYQNNLTLKFGRLYPVFCKEVIPGDSFRINPTFALRFMPLVFPVQTRMQANLHFFYVRNRNLWKDWPDFIGRTKSNLVPPYLAPSVAKRVCQTKGLGDYFGLPTTIVGKYGSLRSYGESQLTYVYGPDGHQTYANYAIAGSYDLSVERTKRAIGVSNVEGERFGIFTPSINALPLIDDEGHSYLKMSMSQVGTDCFDQELTALHFAVYWRVGDDYKLIADSGNYLVFDNKIESAAYEEVISSMLSSDMPIGVGFNYLGGDYSDAHIVVDMAYNDLLHPTDTSYFDFQSCNLFDLVTLAREKFGNLDYRICLYSLYGAGYADTIFHGSNLLSPPFGGQPSELIVDLDYDGVSDIADVGASLNPYATGDIHVSALPFRAYESIYNAFYRNQFNDPFTINGVVEYNKFITNSDGGEDSTPYDFFNRNWEMDFLTSAKQSPVDGDITPLVGVSGDGKFTFKNADDTTYTVTPVVGEDGHTLTGIQSVEGSPENNSGVRRLTDLISVGISINDFRNVNALQRWLETNLRRGYRYKDQIMSHFGVDVRYDELDMPEFIGGMSEPVLVNQVNQTVDATDSPSGLGDFSKVLGSFAGQASVIASSNHSVEKYCDEHGFIIGILSISPVPNYSQLLPKMFVKDSVLDYYFPEFGHIGNQPIPYREVVPLQSYAAGDPLTDVFGYQRAWYDYLASVDEVHGDFRTSLDGFLINRIFDVRPQLGKSFIEVDSDSMSDPFAVTGDDDKILGQLYFNVTAQRPIPKFGIPRLE